MRKLFYLFMVAMCATMFSACSDDDDKDPLEEEGEGKEGVITMVCKDDRISLDAGTLKEGEIITIDWGDGNVEEFKSIRIYGYWDGQWYEDGNDFENEIHYVISNTDDYYDRYRISHEYPNSKSYTITIKGNIKSLYSMRNNLTSLDVSKNTALTVLNCSINNLTSLDVSKNTKLTLLSCDDNNLTSLNVSKNTKLTELWCEYNNLTSAALNQIFRDLPQVTRGTIYIYGNPGTDTCDESIAEKKGWEVGYY